MKRQMVIVKDGIDDLCIKIMDGEKVKFTLYYVDIPGQDFAGSNMGMFRGDIDPDLLKIMIGRKDSGS